MNSAFVRVLLLLLAWLTLSSFRLAPGDRPPEMAVLYDVRGAFVSAPPTVSRRLVTETDRLVDEAIRATFRATLLPRAVLTVRIIEVKRQEYIVGGRFSADVSVDATAVGNGEKIAAGVFSVSSFSLHPEYGDVALARRIADRISFEFRLQETGPSTLATALFPRF
ncbi:hypothetical protein ASD54_06740 [Rhizobium sp. Root149]|uniref:Phenylpyruvate tautomerase PptA (4-oxalocrotonate tautomerase family) n=1 Tax=Rhizobium rhizoryzae TaxID=451876 RepID=A0A7W6LDA2_9HYPH|nr:MULTISPECIES: hypothetical protein [Rhizobium]KQZ54984.1 hypothetical protein ASD54_06740 [Rhizobium sp. Root149]MBB4142116.1 phenylpyruvate tautomerase PptA (4-oxalocrotonate tautomerase family) [Rhizobium rhizoryzae]